MQLSMRKRLAVCWMALALAASCSIPSDREESTPDSDPGGELTDGADDSAGATMADDSATTVTTGADVDPSTLEGDELIAYVAARYRRFWSEFDRARQAPTADPEIDYPTLAGLAGGTQLDTSLDTIRQMHEAGEALQEPDQSAVATESPLRLRVEIVDASTAQVQACLINDAERILVATGDVLAADVRTVEADATMVWTDDDWKLIRSQAVGIEPGVGGCWDNEADYPH